MKHLLFAAILLTGFQQSQAQFFAFGIKGGLHSQLQKPDDITIGNGDDSFDLGIDKRQFGTQFGGFFRFGNRIFIQPEVVFNSNRTDYRIGESSVAEVIKNEKYQFLDLPLLAGFKLGPLRLMGGPAGHYHLNSTSELTDIKGYQARFKQMTWGYQAGLSLSLGRLSIDARYEGNFNKMGDHLTFFGDEYHFSKAPTRLIVGLSFAIIQ